MRTKTAADSVPQTGQQLHQNSPTHSAASVEADCYLTEQQFCERFHVSPRTAQRWRKEGRFGPPFIRAGARRVLFRLSDCERWAEQRRFSTLAEEAAAALVD